ncbi:MAG: hypothetical protein RLZZ156_2128 [Deinococcota bacterium]|jgi:predicted ATPase
MTATAVTTVHVSTLGQIKLEGRSFTRPKAIVFLTYLLFEGRQNRQFLSDFFWQAAEDPMNSLRNQIFQLKPFVLNALKISRQSVEFIGTCDALELLHLIELGQLESAIRLFQGEFLAGFEAPENIELAAWLKTTRQFIKRQVLEAYLQLCEEALVQKNLDQIEPYLEQAQNVLSSGSTDLQPWFARRVEDLRNRIQEQQKQLAPHNLIPSSSEFIGRSQEIKAILNNFQNQAQLLTLFGFGGIGKTTLAFETARTALQNQQYLDGIYFAALETTKTENDLLAKIVTTLEMTLQTSQPMLEQIKTFIAQKSMLMVLDNFEQLTDQTHLIAELLENCPNLRLLCTSREVLGLQAEHVYPISGLETANITSGAVQLFVTRANRTYTNAELEVILKIVRTLQGIPLAIELAVPQLKTFSLSQLQIALQKSMDALQSQTTNLPERQRSIRAVFLHSWALLSQAERQGLQRMAIFKNGANRNALLTVAQTSLSQIANLIDKSFVQRAGQQRYTIHPLILEYTLELLQADSEFAPMLGKHAVYYLDQISSELPKIRGAEAAVVMQKIETDFDNLKAAWAWALENKDFPRIAALEGMVVFFEHKSLLLQGIQFYKPAFELDFPNENQRVFSGLAVNVAWLLYCSGENDQAIQILNDLLIQINFDNSEILRSKVHNTLGNIYLVKQEVQKALDSFENALLFNSKIDNLERHAILLGNKGKVFLALDDFIGAKKIHSEVLEIAKSIKNKHMELTALISLSFIELYMVESPDFEFLANSLNSGYLSACLEHTVLVGYFEFYLAVFNYRIDKKNDAEYWIYRLVTRSTDDIPSYLRVDGKIFLSEMMLDRKLFDYAKSHLNEAYRIATQTGNFTQIIDCKVNYIKYYFAVNKREKAFRLANALEKSQKINVRQKRELRRILLLNAS